MEKDRRTKQSYIRVYGQKNRTNKNGTRSEEISIITERKATQTKQK
jgi:hypothetical protein